MKQHAVAAVLLVLVATLPGSIFAAPRSQSRAPRNHMGHHVHDKTHTTEVELKRARLDLAKESQAFLKQKNRADVLGEKVHELEAELSAEQEKEKKLQRKLDRVRAVVEGDDNQETVPFNTSTQQQNSTAVPHVQDAHNATHHVHYVKLSHGRLSHAAAAAFNKRHQQKHSANPSHHHEQKRRVPSKPVHVRLVNEPHHPAKHSLRHQQKQRVPSKPVHVRLVKEPSHPAKHSLRHQQKQRVPSKSVHVRLVKEPSHPAKDAQVRVHLSHSDVNSTAMAHLVKTKFQGGSHRRSNGVHVAKAPTASKVDGQTETSADADAMFANLTADIGQFIDGDLALHNTNFSNEWQETSAADVTHQETDKRSSDFDDYDKQVEAAWHDVELEDTKGDSSSGIIKTATPNGFGELKEVLSKAKVHSKKINFTKASTHAANEKKETYHSQVEAAWKNVVASDKSMRLPVQPQKKVVMPAKKPVAAAAAALAAAAHQQPASATKQVPKTITATAVNVSNAPQISDTSDFDSDAVLRTYGTVQSIDDVDAKLQEEDQKINQLDVEAANSTQLSSAITGLAHSATMSDDADEVGSPLLTLSPEEAAMTADSQGGEGGDEQFLSQLMSGKSDTDSHV